MTETSKSNFLNNVEAIINNVANNKEPVAIKTEDGVIVLITEEEYKRLVNIKTSTFSK